jgi:hypothetical protein
MTALLIGSARVSTDGAEGGGRYVALVWRRGVGGGEAASASGAFDQEAKPTGWAAWRFAAPVRSTCSSGVVQRPFPRIASFSLQQNSPIPSISSTACSTRCTWTACGTTRLGLTARQELLAATVGDGHAPMSLVKPLEPWRRAGR